LCALFASLMSTVDSTFNSLATLWSVDIYKGYFNKGASDAQMISAGRKTILVTLFTGILMGMVLMYIKYQDSGSAFTHTLNSLLYFINCGIVVLICSAAILVKPSHTGALIGFIITVPLQILILGLYPDINYFFRAFLVIISGLAIVIAMSMRGGFFQWKELFQSADKQVSRMGYLLMISLIIVHIIWH